MPAANLVRLALRKLEGVMLKPPLQRHIALQVATAYLDGAIECARTEVNVAVLADRPYELPDQREAEQTSRIAWDLQHQVDLVMYGFDDEHNAQWASVYAAGMQ
jgi:hypothetical protein